MWICVLGLCEAAAYLLLICAYTLFSLWAGCSKRFALKLWGKTYNLYGRSHFIQVHITKTSSDYRSKEPVFLCFIEFRVQNSCCIVRRLSAFSYGFTRTFTGAPFSLCSLISSYLAKEENSRQIILLQHGLHSP